MHAEALIASILALGAGPLLHHAAGRSRTGVAALQAVVVGAIVALLALHILPECVEIAGIAALLAVALGIVGPMLVEKHVGAVRARVPAMATCLALMALGLHAFADGMALVGSDHHAHSAGGLGLAVVLHRILEGAAVWCLLRKTPGSAALALGGVALATAAGFVFGGHLILGLDEAALALAQAFFGGILLHVIMHISSALPAPASRS